MKKDFITSIVVFLITMFFSLYSVVYAESNFSFIVNPTEKTINIGESVTIDLKIDDIEAGEEGINVVEMDLQYDNTVIENIEIIEENQWKCTYNNVSGKMLWHKMVNGVTIGESIGKLKIITKDNLDDIDTEIYLKSVTSNDGYNLINKGDKVIKLHLKKQAIPTESPTEAPTEAPTPTAIATATPTTTATATPTPTTTDSSTPTVKPTAIVTSTTASKTQNIKTGDVMPIIAIAIIIVVIVGNVIFFVVRKKKKDNK